MMKFIKNHSAFVAISTAILMPAVLGLIWLAYDGGIMIMKHSKLDDATREANLAATLSDNKVSSPKSVGEKFLRYFLGTTADVKIEAIEEFKEKDEKGKEQKGLLLQARLNDKTILTPFKDSKQDYTLRTGSRVIKGGGNGGESDYVFALDYTYSMVSDISAFFDYNVLLAQCQGADDESDEFDTQLCDELKAANTNMKISQAITKKVLKMLAKNNSDSVTYSIIPLAALIQVNREYDYTLGDKTGDKQVVTPYVLKSASDTSGGNDYRLDNMYEYDEISTKFESALQSGISYTLNLNQASQNQKLTNKKAAKIQNLLNQMQASAFELAFTEAVTNENERGVNSIVDVQESIKNMFDLNAGFGFRLNGKDNTKPIVYYLDKNDPNNPITTFSYAPALMGKNPSRATAYVEATETPLKELKSIQSYTENPILDVNDEITLNSEVAMTSMSVVPGIMRGAAHLARGKQPRKVIIMITDGNTSNQTGDVTEIEREFIIKNRLCDHIRDGLKEKGAQEVKIVSIIIGDKRYNKNFYNMMKACTPDENIFFIKDIKTFLETFVGAVNGNGDKTKFDYKNTKGE
ncbi:TadE/TadG family type IV pilus assembly protein [Campylobacter sp. 19-13652]|uniref:TadE/TadG family type IV pilus assembly protein n=1 Tax=Campylobacter sp. 19-13652 TaxID=2840180 RepID=UPI001C7873F2|nr:hypothetical protein [Campylobacter sp. 19-13652]BCX78546.1 hypothetical protein LBC_00080 [Campylobacter sp. 19-13652]